MEKYLLLTFLLLIITSCSNQDEPKPTAFTQVSEISNGSTTSHNITYDEYGRVSKYTAVFSDESVNATYSYPADDIITIHTVCEQNGVNHILREYEDKIYLENGRASYCDGVFSMTGHDDMFQKKYRHEFIYTSDNHLNVIKWTEWNREGNDWAYDKPLTWENYYIWENGNLVEVEDYNGNSTPTYTYNYSFSDIEGVQNIIAARLGRYQYYPLQLKEIFGAQSRNLISIEKFKSNVLSYEIKYEYNIAASTIIRYLETRNNISDEFTVTRIK